MKKLFKILAIICCLALLLPGCQAPQPTATAPTDKEDTTMLSKEKTYAILFIGNSYTFYNDMPTIYFANMAKSCGYKVEVTTITKGAYTLSKFADPADNYGKMVESALNRPGAFDYVILQEQSVRPASDSVTEFYDAVRNLAGRIRAAGAKPILYATWGRETGTAKLEELGMTNESMTWKLAAAYDAIGTELEIPVVHTGLAFYDVYTNSDISLYSADGSHPSATGSYLVAMMLFCGIFGEDPTQAAFTYSLAPEEDAVLRTAAKQTLRDTPAIPEEYRVSSAESKNN